MTSPDESALLERFEALLRRVDGSRPLGFDELRELSRLYRLHAAKLSQSRRRRHADPEAARYLNALCVRAYSHLHDAPRPPRRVRTFWWRALPDALARTARLQGIASLVLAAGILVGALSVARDATALPALVPAAMYPPTALERLATSTRARQDFLRRADVGFADNSLFSASLFTNNTRVGLLSFAVGPLLGVPTLLLVLHNGLTLGAFSGIFLGTDQTLTFLAWIVPHGIPELLAILLCATGGLAMGVAVVAPGRRGRGVALRAAARDGGALLVGSLPLFALAALIESFIRQSTLSTAARFAVAGGVTLGLVAYVATVAALSRRPPRVDAGFLGGSQALPVDRHSAPRSFK